MAFNGSPFEAPTVNGRIEGNGKYTFANGNVYVGSFKDGKFHGDGILHFPDGSKYESKWVNGTSISGKYIFADSLVFDNDNMWNYCTGTDRRFHSEVLNGIKPANKTQLTNDGVLRDIPENSFDTGDGFFSPNSGWVYGYDGEELRQPDEAETLWIQKHCRMSGAGKQKQAIH